MARTLGLALIVTALLAACGGAAPAPAGSSFPAAKSSVAGSAAQKPSAGTAAVAKDGPSFTFKLATGFPQTDFSAQGLQHWADMVGERTGGRIKFQFFWAASLLNTTQLFQGIRDGLADFGDPATSFTSGQVPDVASFEVPFSYPLDNDHTLPFYREIEPVMDQIYSSAGRQHIVWMEDATSSIPSVVTCKNKFLDSAQAWQGALVRTAGKWQGATAERWGAKPVVIDLSEAYSAIQRGTADCLLFTYSLLDSFKMYEVAKNLTRIDHSVNLATVDVNADSWNKLPAADQQILKQAGTETEDWLLGQRTQVIDQSLNHLKQMGMNMCVPTQQELARLRAATEPVLADIAKTQTDKGKRLQDISKKYRDMVKTPGPVQGDMTPCPAK
ncbi:MAG TPA: TRAP transporter substrate-binding protein [Chloroflexota bacterium]